MENLNALIRLVSEGGWRLGVPLMLIGLAVLAAHKNGLPEVGAVAPFIGWAALATIAGTAFTLVSIITHFLSAAATSIRMRRAKAADEREFAENVRANLQTLNPIEAVRLREILLSGQKRVQVSVLNEAWGLIEKGILIQVAGSLHQPICEVPTPLIEHRDEIVGGITKAMKESSAFANIQTTCPVL